MKNCNFAQNYSEYGEKQIRHALDSIEIFEILECFFLIFSHQEQDREQKQNTDVHVNQGCHPFEQKTSETLLLNVVSATARGSGGMLPQKIFENVRLK